jgi:hypothetical protein
MKKKPELTELECAVLEVVRLLVPKPEPRNYGAPTVAIPLNSFRRVIERMNKAELAGLLTKHQITSALEKLDVAIADIAKLVLPVNADKLAAFNLWLDAAIEQWAPPVPQPPASGPVQPIHPIPRGAP